MIDTAVHFVVGGGERRGKGREADIYMIYSIFSGVTKPCRNYIFSYNDTDQFPELARTFGDG